MEEIRVLSSADPQIKKALSVFDEAADLAGLDRIAPPVDGKRVADLRETAGEEAVRQP